MKRRLPPLARSLMTVVLAGALFVPVLGQPLARATAPRASGGTLNVTAQADLPSLDPAIAYDRNGYNTVHNIFNGLLDYKQKTLQLEPSIAASWPTVSKDGLVWTFTLRKGVM